MTRAHTRAKRLCTRIFTLEHTHTRAKRFCERILTNEQSECVYKNTHTHQHRHNKASETKFSIRIHKLFIYVHNFCAVMEQLRAERLLLEEIEKEILKSVNQKPVYTNLHEWAARELKALADSMRGVQVEMTDRRLELPEEFLTSTHLAQKDHFFEVEDLPVKSSEVVVAPCSRIVQSVCSPYDATRIVQPVGPSNEARIVQSVPTHSSPYDATRIVQPGCTDSSSLLIDDSVFEEFICPSPQPFFAIQPHAGAQEGHTLQTTLHALQATPYELQTTPHALQEGGVLQTTPLQGEQTQEPPLLILQKILADRKAAERLHIEQIREWVAEADIMPDLLNAKSRPYTAPLVRAPTHTASSAHDSAPKHAPQTASSAHASAPTRVAPSVIEIDISDFQRQRPEAILKHFSLNRVVCEEILQLVGQNRPLYLLHGNRAQHLRAVYIQRNHRFEKLFSALKSPPVLSASFVTRIFVWERDHFVEQPTGSLPLSKVDAVCTHLGGKD